MEENNTPQPSPQDELNTLEGEINDAMNAFEHDFALAAAQKVNENPELEELFFDNREEFFKRIVSFQNEFLESIKGKISKANELRGEIDESQKQADFDTKLQEFAKAHPQINMQELMEFANTLPQEIREQLDQLPTKFFFDTLLELYNRKDEILGDTQKQPQEESLPDQINGVASNQELNADENLPMTRQ